MTITVEVIIIAVLFFTSFVSIALSVKEKLRATKMTTAIAQLVIDKAALQEELDRLSFISSNSTDIENGFIKFLSETRESAYEYIGKVQDSIQGLKTAMLSGNDEEISKRYNDLLEFLPSNDEENL